MPNQNNLTTPQLEQKLYSDAQRLGLVALNSTENSALRATTYELGGERIEIIFWRSPEKQGSLSIEHKTERALSLATDLEALGWRVILTIADKLKAQGAGHMA